MGERIKVPYAGLIVDGEEVGDRIAIDADFEWTGVDQWHGAQAEIRILKPITFAPNCCGAVVLVAFFAQKRGGLPLAWTNVDTRINTGDTVTLDTTSVPLLNSTGETSG